MFKIVMKRVKSFLANFHFCKKCLHITYIPYKKYSQYTRAYNSLCRQAAGAVGYMCGHCTHVEWEEPDFEKWLEKEPKWIVPYGEKSR